MSLSTFEPLGFVLGIAILLVLEVLKKWTAQRETAEQGVFMKPEINLKEL